MRPDDVIIEVRGKDFTRSGQVPLEDVRKAQFIKRFNTTGAWTITMPDVTAVSQLLKQPGSGIIVWLYGQPWLSGPMVNFTRAKTATDARGVTTYVGVDDMVLLSDPLLYPVPGQPDVTLQTDAYDDRSGACETVLKGYVNANIGPGAGALRRPAGTLLSGLTVEADQGRGGHVVGHARFDKPGLFFQTLCAAEGTIGFDVLQPASATSTRFRCYQVADRSGTVRMDVDNDMLREVDSGIAAPSTTVAIVAGQGVGAERTFVQYEDSLSQAAAAAWGRRIETFIDQRQTNDQAQLAQAGTKEIETNGRTTVSLKVTPTDSTTMLLGRDWNPGDLVGVVVDGQPLVDVVTEAIVSVDQASVKVAATVGDPTGYDWEAAVTSLLTDHETRLDSLERNSETGTATTSTVGQVQLASVAQAQAGASTTTAVTPAGVSAAVAAGSAGKGVNGYLSASASIPAGSGTLLNLTQDYDDDLAYYTFTGGGIRCNVAGLYLFTWRLQVTPSAATTGSAFVQVNGSTFAEAAGYMDTNGVRLNGSLVTRLTSAATVTLLVYCGQTATTGAGFNNVGLSIAYLGG